MAGWKGIGQMKHRIRRVDLGDLVTYQAVTSTVWGLWLDTGRLWVLLDLPKGRAWVPSDDCMTREWKCEPYQNGKGWFHERGCPHVDWMGEVPADV